MSTITWKAPPKVMRGVVVEGIDSGSISAISTTECWGKVASLCGLLANPSEPISVVCEIWPDTGRIIWIQKDTREFCRLELTVSDLERRYFEISSSQNFEYDYDELLSQIKHAVRNGTNESDLGFAYSVTIRDSDDSVTDEIVK